MVMSRETNFVLILADDMGYGDLSCLNNESKIHTEEMDRIASEGMTFTDVHAGSSVCTPSRYGILAGRYAWRGRLQRGVLGPYDPPLLEDDLITLPQMLKYSGYRTACVGKWHLGMDWPGIEQGDMGRLKCGWGSPERTELGRIVDYDAPIKNGPCEHGFDYYFGVDVPNFPPYCFIENNRTVGIPNQRKPDDMYGIPGPMADGWRLEEIMPTLERIAVDFITDAAGKDEPFFLYFPMTGPHTPIAPLEEFKGKSDAGIYGDFVTQLDHTVGEIDKTLRDSGISENTILVVASDNGSPGRNGSLEAPGTVVETFGHNPSWILRGMKADTWDGGHRIPFLVKWPGKINPGKTSAELACLTDLMATFAEAAEVNLPDTAQDSVSLMPLLTDGKPVRKSIIHHGYRDLYGIRKGKWKLIIGTGSGGFSPDPKVDEYAPPGQLYDMENDVRERKNLYFDRPDVVRELTSEFIDVKFGM